MENLQRLSDANYIPTKVPKTSNISFLKKFFHVYMIKTIIIYTSLLTKMIVICMINNLNKMSVNDKKTLKINSFWSCLNLY